MSELVTHYERIAAVMTSEAYCPRFDGWIPFWLQVSSRTCARLKAERIPFNEQNVEACVHFWLGSL